MINDPDQRAEFEADVAAVADALPALDPALRKVMAGFFELSRSPSTATPSTATASARCTPSIRPPGPRHRAVVPGPQTAQPDTSESSTDMFSARRGRVGREIRVVTGSPTSAECPRSQGIALTRRRDGAFVKHEAHGVRPPSG
jgi:hypothetical protein